MSSYFSKLQDKAGETIQAICDELRSEETFGTGGLVVGMGMSGTLPLVPVHLAAGLAFRAIRKGDDSSHGSADPESPRVGTEARYVIIDDLVDTGATVRTIIDKLPKHWECAGVLLYQSNETSRMNVPEFIPHLNVCHLPFRNLGREVHTAKEVSVE